MKQVVLAVLLSALVSYSITKKSEERVQSRLDALIEQVGYDFGDLNTRVGNIDERLKTIYIDQHYMNSDLADANQQLRMSSKEMDQIKKDNDLIIKMLLKMRKNEPTKR